MGYFFDRIPNNTLLHTWVSQMWSVYGVKVENVLNITKGFSLFQFSNPLHAHKVLNKGPWIVCNSLLVLQPYKPSFNVANEGAMDVIVWVEFLGLPILLWTFLEYLGDSIDQFIFFEPKRFFFAQPSS